MTAPARPFPALDDEPDTRSRRGGVIAVVLLLVAGTVAAALALWSSGAERTPVSSIGTSGAVVFWRADGSLAIADPDGTGVRSATGGGATAAPPTVSPTGGLAVTDNGDLWALSATGLRKLTETAYGDHLVGPAAGMPFADGDAYLARGGRGPYGQVEPALLVDRDTGAATEPDGPSRPDAVVGDPAAAAMYLTIPLGLPVSGSSGFRQAIRSVVRVDINGRSVALISATQARQLLDLSGPVELFVRPSPDGRRIAVEAIQMSGTGAGVVVIDRGGGVVDAFRVSGSLDGVAWSPDSTALVVVGNLPSSMLVWRDKHVQRLSVRLPPARHFGAFCQWSPDGQVVLCPVLSSTVSVDWLLVRVSDGSTSLAPAPGIPIAWLGGSS